MFSILFWVIWVLGLIWGGWHGFFRPEADRGAGGSWLAAWVLFGILGWKVIGFTP